MKAFVAAVVAMVVIGAGTWAVLDKNLQETSEHKFATPSVRLPAGH